MSGPNTRRYWLSPCGLDCGACSIDFRTEEELDYCRKKGADIDAIRCDGCRSERSGSHWSADCKILRLRCLRQGVGVLLPV